MQLFLDSTGRPSAKCHDLSILISNINALRVGYIKAFIPKSVLSFQLFHANERL